MYSNMDGSKPGFPLSWEKLCTLMASLRIFNIQKLLSLYTGEKIWEQTKENYKRKKYFSQALLGRMGGKLLCTTDGSVIALLMPNGRKLASALSLFQPVGLRSLLQHF